jgi:hypothetical protein
VGLPLTVLQHFLYEENTAEQSGANGPSVPRIILWSKFIVFSLGRKGKYI